MCYVAVTRIRCKRLQIGDIRPPHFSQFTWQKSTYIFSISFSKTRYVSLLLGMFKYFLATMGKTNWLNQTKKNFSLWNEPFILNWILPNRFWTRRTYDTDIYMYLTLYLQKLFIRLWKWTMMELLKCILELISPIPYSYSLYFLISYSCFL